MTGGIGVGGGIGVLLGAWKYHGAEIMKQVFFVYATYFPRFE